MIKFIIVGFTNPNLQTSKADIQVMCVDDVGCVYWIPSTEIDSNPDVKEFCVRAIAQQFIDDAGLENCITYGIKKGGN